MNSRDRVKTYGSAVAAMVAGVACSASIAGTTGEVIGIVLVSLGGVAAVSLLFYEVGLSEDRQRRAVRSAPPGSSDRDDRAPRPSRTGRELAVPPLEQHRPEGQGPAQRGHRSGAARRIGGRPRPPRRPQ